MNAVRLSLLILCALALQWLLPAIGDADRVPATTSAASQDVPTFGAPHGTTPSVR